MENHPADEKLTRLCQTFAQIRSTEDIRLLLEDLCTKKEIENMAERLYAAELLIQGNTYNQVMAQANISSASSLPRNIAVTSSVFDLRSISANCSGYTVFAMNQVLIRAISKLV